MLGATSSLPAEGQGEPKRSLICTGTQVLESAYRGPLFHGLECLGDIVGVGAGQG